MINLNNTWCEATEENYNALLECGIKAHLGMSVKHIRNKVMEYIFVYEDGKSMWYQAYGQKKPKGKQIHVVNGQFEYVEEKESEMKKYADMVADSKEVECQFSKYGLEKPDFKHCIKIDILKEVSLSPCTELREIYRKEKRLIGYGLFPDGTMMFEWDERGIEVNGSDFNLTPLKKEWYEDESNFGKLCVREINEETFDAEDNTKFIYGARIENTLFGLSLNTGEEIKMYCKNARLATKEEVLSLYKETK